MSDFNIKFPSVDDKSANTFYKMNKTTRDGLVSNLYNLVLTSKGERYYNPDFGTNLLKYIFEPNDQITLDDIEKSIKADVEKYIPELTITSFGIDNDETNKDENKLVVSIGFRYGDSTFSEDGTINIEI
jgi:phage baseplate assembly protein W